MTLQAKERLLRASRFAQADDGRRASRSEPRGKEVALQRMVSQPWDRDDFAGGLATAKILRRAFAHVGERGPGGIAARQGNNGGLVIVDGTKPVASRGDVVSAAERGIAALLVAIGNCLPFTVPGVVVSDPDPARAEQTFGNSRATVLSCRQKLRQLNRQVLMFRPVGPARRISLDIHAKDGHHPQILQSKLLNRTVQAA